MKPGESYLVRVKYGFFIRRRRLRSWDEVTPYFGCKRGEKMRDEGKASLA